MKCWAEHYCKKAGGQYCNEFCDAFILLRALYNQSNIPEIYQYHTQLKAPKGSENHNDFIMLSKWKENIIEHVEDGDGLYLFGKQTGTGKTTWACKMINHYFRKIVFDSNLENESVFIGIPRFLEQIRDSFDNPSDEFQTLKEQVIHSNIAVFDDIGAEKPSQWVRERLYTIINERVLSGLSTIYTSNISLRELEERYNKRIASRIKGSCQVVHFEGKDWREVE